MNKTKHFKRLWGLMLLLVAMLAPQGAWAENFISEVKYGVNGNQNTAKGYLSGYTIIDHDFNNGTDGNWVYIGYKTSTNAADAITGLLVVTNDTESNSSTYGDSGFKFGGAKTMMVDGKRYYLAEWGGYADMNHGNKTHKNPVYLYYTKDGNTTNGAQLITTLDAHRGELTTNPAGLYVAPLYGGNGSNTNGTYSLSKLSDFGDTNKGGGGSFNYITYTTHTHAYTAAFNWATNGKSCTATTNCAGCGDTHSNLACTVTDAPKSGAAATCTVMGWTTYTAKVTSNGKDFSATKDVQDIAALGHGTTGYTESYSWTGNAYNDASQDTKACIFTLTCKKCSTKVVNGASLTCIKTAHVDATCRATGSTTYQATGSYTAANSAYNYSATKTNEYPIAALGHGSTGYTESYVWTGNAYNDWSQDIKACIFTLTCKNCSTKVVNGASLTCIKTAHVDATCRATGSTTYQATGSYTAANSAYNYSATKTHEYPIAALGHSYGAGAWSWADDGHSATCTRTCSRTGCYSNIPGHTSSKSVTLGNGITSVQQVAPNCTTKGTTLYTATATVEGTQYSDTKDVVDIAALDHDYSQVVDEDYLVSAATCGSDAIYHEKCSRCDTHGAEWSATGTATGNHTFTNKTLTDDPIEDGLYAYACDNGCGTHTDDHIIKYFYGEGGHHLELTKDGEGNYSTSEDIIINESDYHYPPGDFSLPVDFTAASVTFNRYFVNDGGMWSFIVPFDIPAAQAAQLGKFYQYSKHEEGKVYFDDITTIDNADGIVRANTAYFFEPAKEILSITVENPTFGTTGNMADATNPSEPGVYGTYSQIDIPVGAYGYAIYWGESTFVKAGTGNVLRPFRAYLWLGSGASMAKARAFFGDYDVDAIELIGADDLDLNAPIYTLSGQRITTPKKGEIYIQNGKKVMKK